MTALKTILFMKLYRSNLLLAIMRPAVETTPSTLAEVVSAVEEGSLWLLFTSHGTTECAFLSPTVADDELYAEFDG